MNASFVLPSVVSGTTKYYGLPLSNNILVYSILCKYEIRINLYGEI